MEGGGIIFGLRRLTVESDGGCACHAEAEINARTEDVFHFLRYDVAALLAGGCGDHSVHGRKIETPMLRAGCQLAPTFSDSFGNRKNAVGEPWANVVINVWLKRFAPAAVR